MSTISVFDGLINLSLEAGEPLRSLVVDKLLFSLGSTQIDDLLLPLSSTDVDLLLSPICSTVIDGPKFPLGSADIDDLLFPVVSTASDDLPYPLGSAYLLNLLASEGEGSLLGSDGSRSSCLEPLAPIEVDTAEFPLDPLFKTLISS